MAGAASLAESGMQAVEGSPCNLLARDQLMRHVDGESFVGGVAEVGGCVSGGEIYLCNVRRGQDVLMLEPGKLPCLMLKGALAAATKKKTCQLLMHACFVRWWRRFRSFCPAQALLFARLSPVKQPRLALAESPSPWLCSIIIYRGSAIRNRGAPRL